MFQVGEGAGFALEPLAEVGALGQVRGQGLDGHDAVEARVAGFVHFAHASLTNQGDDLMRTKQRAGFERHLLPIIPIRAATARERWHRTLGALASGKRTVAGDP